jgi:hypothetical protein
MRTVHLLLAVALLSTAVPVVLAADEPCPSDPVVGTSPPITVPLWSTVCHLPDPTGGGIRHLAECVNDLAVVECYLP